MFATGTGIFIHLPTDSETRTLHPAQVVGVEGETYTAEFEEDDIVVEPGTEVFVYFERNREFMQQSARIDAVSEGEMSPIIGFETTADAVSAESRQCYRVSTITANMTAALGAEDSCVLTDVSATGFSVIAGEEHRIGTTLSTTLHHQGRNFTGTACVQSCTQLGPGRTRYGLHCGDSKSAGELPKGLQQISMTVQRQQLRRAAGA